jgi:hypothetical protein
VEVVLRKRRSFSGSDLSEGFVKEDRKRSTQQKPIPELRHEFQTDRLIEKQLQTLDPDVQSLLHASDRRDKLGAFHFFGRKLWPFVQVSGLNEFDSQPRRGRTMPDSEAPIQNHDVSRSKPSPEFGVETVVDELVVVIRSVGSQDVSRWTIGVAPNQKLEKVPLLVRGESGVLEVHVLWMLQIDVSAVAQ